jgi:hypothetical protein
VDCRGLGWSCCCVPNACSASHCRAATSETAWIQSL